MRGEDYPEDDETPRRLFSIRVFILIVLIAFAVPVAYGGLQELYDTYLELSPPRIDFEEFPRGVGLAPVNIRFKVTDEGAGLDEVVVRIRQRGQFKEILRRQLDGKFMDDETLSFPGQESGLEEGVAYLEIRAFDRSFWNNRGEKSAELRIDFRKPKIEVLSKQHNARRGGSQMVFYKVFDEDIAISGVKVGTKTFEGYLARGLDKMLDDRNLHVAFYAIDLNQNPDELPIRIFAEDVAGNGSSVPFYHKVADRSQRQVNVTLSEDFMREQIVRLVDQNYRKLGAAAEDFENDPELSALDPLVKKFKLVNEVLRGLNESDLVRTLETNPRFESFISGFFLRPNATVQSAFGDVAVYRFHDQEVGRAVQLGQELALARGEREVVAVNDGIVMSSENVGMYGRMVILDHGLGLTSVYGHLDEVSVRKGDSVKRGQAVGLTGKTGFARGSGFYLEMRVHGVAVDPVEWFDPNWFKPHILDKTNDLKRDLGIPVYIPLS